MAPGPQNIWIHGSGLSDPRIRGPRLVVTTKGGQTGWTKVGRCILDPKLSLDSYAVAPRGPRASSGRLLSSQRNVTSLMDQGRTTPHTTIPPPHTATTPILPYHLPTLPTTHPLPYHLPTLPTTSPLPYHLPTLPLHPYYHTAASVTCGRRLSELLSATDAVLLQLHVYVARLSVALRHEGGLTWLQARACACTCIFTRPHLTTPHLTSLLVAASAPATEPCTDAHPPRLTSAALTTPYHPLPPLTAA